MTFFACTAQICEQQAHNIHFYFLYIVQSHLYDLIFLWLIMCLVVKWSSLSKKFEEVFRPTTGGYEVIRPGELSTARKHRIPTYLFYNINYWTQFNCSSRGYINLEIHNYNNIITVSLYLCFFNKTNWHS